MNSKIVERPGGDLLPARVVTGDPKIPGYVAAFLRIQASPNTARAYRYGLDSWLAYCGRYGLDPLNVRRAHGQLWEAEMRDEGLSDGTRANRLSAVSSWYRWMAENDIDFRTNPAEPGRRRPKAHPRKTPALSKEQMVALLDAADADGPRSAAFVWILVTTGIRVAELLSADVEDIGYDSGHPVLNIVGKGGQRRSPVLVPPTMQRIADYRSTVDTETRLPTRTAGARPRRPLIATDTGRRVDPRTIGRILRRLACRAGLPEAVINNLGPHVARATYVTLNLAAGKSLQEVQAAVGHASPTTTQGYDRSNLSADNHPSYALMALISDARARNNPATTLED
ncbi:tyrosine-type recombinase/integrase [Micromonospora sp. NPDC005652]|uniref:tyrosine-type recombinase/integrase n=1 Tax=Micromonospora sp. NPDC005652 TaxID=3157046 RepID=UPI0033DF94F7